jgi:hypothetical protein
VDRKHCVSLPTPVFLSAFVCGFLAVGRHSFPRHETWPAGRFFVITVWSQAISCRPQFAISVRGQAVFSWRVRIPWRR